MSYKKLSAFHYHLCLWQSCYVAQARFELKILLPSSPKYWDYRLVTPYPAQYHFLEFIKLTCNHQIPFFLSMSSLLFIFSCVGDWTQGPTHFLLFQHHTLPWLVHCSLLAQHPDPAFCANSSNCSIYRSQELSVRDGVLVASQAERDLALKLHLITCSLCSLGTES